jgi:hypothetical protein
VRRRAAAAGWAALAIGVGFRTRVLGDREIPSQYSRRRSMPAYSPATASP